MCTVLLEEGGEERHPLEGEHLEGATPVCINIVE